MITVKLGKYNFYDPENKQRIEWIIIDKKDNCYLMVSKYLLAYAPYHNYNRSATWEYSDLRRWLNNEFINDAFSPEEQEMIITSTVTADENPFVVWDVGNDTQDKVFLLSIMDVYKYFHSPSQRKCNWPNGFAEPHSLACESASWWLRTSNKSDYYASCVNYDGSIDSNQHLPDEVFVGVRPAIWVKFRNMPNLPVENLLFAGYNEDSSLIDKLLTNKIQKDVVQKKLEEAREIARQQREIIAEGRITEEKAEQLYDKCENTMKILEDK